MSAASADIFEGTVSILENLIGLNENNKRVDGQDMPLVEPTEAIVTIKNKKTGEVYKNRRGLKTANIPQDDVQRDVLVKMPSLDLFRKNDNNKTMAISRSQIKRQLRMGGGIIQVTSSKNIVWWS